MPVRSFEGKTPDIGKETYIHPSADVFGDVTIGERCWIGPGARIRGEWDQVVPRVVAESVRAVQAAIAD